MPLNIENLRRSVEQWEEQQREITQLESEIAAAQAAEREILADGIDDAKQREALGALRFKIEVLPRRLEELRRQFDLAGIAMLPEVGRTKRLLTAELIAVREKLGSKLIDALEKTLGCDEKIAREVWTLVVDRQQHRMPRLRKLFKALGGLNAITEFPGDQVPPINRARTLISKVEEYESDPDLLGKAAK